MAADGLGNGIKWRKGLGKWVLMCMRPFTEAERRDAQDPVWRGGFAGVRGDVEGYDGFEKDGCACALIFSEGGGYRSVFPSSGILSLLIFFFTPLVISVSDDYITSFLACDGFLHASYVVCLINLFTWIDTL